MVAVLLNVSGGWTSYRSLIHAEGTLAWPHSVHEIRETIRAVGVREVAIGQIHAMCLHIHPPRDPPFTITPHSALVSNESTRTTDRDESMFLCKRTTFYELSERDGFQRHIHPSPFHGSISKNRSLFQAYSL